MQVVRWDERGVIVNICTTQTFKSNPLTPSEPGICTPFPLFPCLTPSLSVLMFRCLNVLTDRVNYRITTCRLTAYNRASWMFTGLCQQLWKVFWTLCCLHCPVTITSTRLKARISNSVNTNSLCWTCKPIFATICRYILFQWRANMHITSKSIQPSGVWSHFCMILRFVKQFYLRPKSCSELWLLKIWTFLTRDNKHGIIFRLHTECNGLKNRSHVNLVKKEDQVKFSRIRMSGIVRVWRTQSNIDHKLGLEEFLKITFFPQLAFNLFLFKKKKFSIILSFFGGVMLIWKLK